MRSIKLLLLYLLLCGEFLYSQNHMPFESGGMSNQDVMTEWASAGSNACKSHRYPDYIFNAVEDLGMDNNYGLDNNGIGSLYR